MIGADAIIKCLEEEGVSTVFGYPGVAICPFFNSILDSDIKTVLIRTEQNAAHAASGVARMTGRPGVCGNLRTGRYECHHGYCYSICGQYSTDLYHRSGEQRTAGKRCIPGGGHHRRCGIFCEIQLSGKKCK